MLILLEMDGEAAHSICERLLQRMAEFDWNRVHMGLNQITMSIGITTWNSIDANTPDSAQRMVALADQRMYQAKASGKNRMAQSG